MNRIIRFSAWTFTLLAATCALQILLSPAAALVSVPSPAEKTEPLYRFRNSKGNELYKAGANLPQDLAGETWKSEGVVAHVPIKSAESKPVFGFIMKTDSSSYYYTSDQVEATLKATVGGWSSMGVVFHVARQQLPDTVPFYRMSSPGGANPKIGYVIGDKNKGAPGGLTKVQAVIGYLWLQPFEPKINIKPDTSGKFHSPSVAITGIQPVPPGPVGGPRTKYRIEVTNWQSYPADLYQSTKNVLPKHPCGDTRAFAQVFAVQGGQQLKRECKGLVTVEDFKRFVIMMPGELADNDKVFVVLHDRLTGLTYESEPFLVGWFGVGKLLGPVGCKSFLGRSSHYLCMSEQGMTACENLQKQGKPIKCTRAGKPAK